MTDNNSWDYLIEYTKDKVNKDSLDWLVIPELKKGAEPAFRNGTKTALVSNIIGQYMQALEIEEEKTGAPAEPEFTDFKKSFNKFYKNAQTQILADLGIYHTRALDGKEPEHLLAIKPEEHTIVTDKISNNAFIKAFTNDLKAVAMEKRGSLEEVNTFVAVNYDGLDRAKVQGVKWLTLFDREVLDAVHTLFKAGNKFVTVDQINRVMNGKSGEERATKAQADRINNSLTKMMYTQIIIDASQEAEFFGYERFYYDKSVIVGERGEAVINGIKVAGIYIYALALLGYAENKNQIARVPLLVKNTPINKNENTQVLQGYLLRRVNAIRVGALNNSILLDTLLTELDILELHEGALTSLEKKIRKRAIDQSTTILDYWKQIDFIKDYELIGKRPITGFKVYV